MYLALTVRVAGWWAGVEMVAVMGWSSAAVVGSGSRVKVSRVAGACTGTPRAASRARKMSSLYLRRRLRTKGKRVWLKSRSKCDQPRPWTRSPSR
ncbi:hypothetical protein Tdes44962_MAKER05923 [Teratosphaeria destructans]|uniref:Uncharacterized protein n=1 Tax=Teratosphaeria destructans TaxID=418781 RepID=A0A9W7SIK0_9PEZI|nr:hypothetical protein Tdes44962_MAKER05923 [Teratosphaeria destructans]